MKIIISPSKTQLESSKDDLKGGVPFFNQNAIEINDLLKKEIQNNVFFLKELEIKSNNISLKNNTINNILNFNSKYKNFAIQKYNGIQFKQINFNNLTNDQKQNLNNNLYILSAYYGILKPNDLISSYRLMMKSKFKINNLLLKDYWKQKISNYLKNELIINLSSEEYSYVLDTNLLNVVNINFLIKKNNEIKNIATNSKICRGLMVKELSNYKNITIEEIKKIMINNHKYNENLSSKNNIVFLLTK